MASLAPPPDSHARNDDLDPMGLTSHPQLHSLHGSIVDNGTAPRDSSTNQLEHANSEHPSHPQSKDPSHVGGLPLDAQQPPPIPRADPALLVPDGGDLYLDNATTAERVQDNLWLAVSLALGTVFWLISLISQAIVTANQSNGFVRTAWLALVLQLLLILITFSLLLTTHLHPYHIQISTLAAMVVVLGSLAVDANIYTPSTSAQKALAASWLLTCLLDILFVLYFSAPPQHPLAIFLQGGYRHPDTHTEAYRKSNFFAGGAQSNRNTVTGYQTAPPNRLSRAGSGNIELGPVGGNGGGNRLSMTRSQSGRPLSGIPETTVSGGARSSGTTDDVQPRPQMPQQGERKSGRFSLYRREKEKEKEREREREREREQQQADSHSQAGGGSVSAAPGHDSAESRPGKPVVCTAEALFACECSACFSIDYCVFSRVSMHRIALVRALLCPLL